jgi:hypothetical protein
MSYYNTTGESAQLLLNYRATADNQDAQVLKAFARLKRPLGASEIYEFLRGSFEIPMETPITSIRRSITNLTGEMKLRKTEEKGKGRYGRSECKWQII